MKITNEFTVPIPIDQAWRVLTDLEGVARCMPGARLTGVDGEIYQGRVKVKVGPVISDFSGTARFVEKDPTAYRAVIDAKGRDARSAGNAAAVISAALTADGENSTKVAVDTDLKISGKLAQFGSGMIKEVSAKLLAQFVTNLEAKLAADPAPAGDPGSASNPAPAAASTSTSTSGPAAVPHPEPTPVTDPDPALAAVMEPGAAPAAPASPAASASPVVPDPSAGEVEQAAGRIETAVGTPEPVAPLRTPNADLPAAAADVSATSGTAAVGTAPGSAVPLAAAAPASALEPGAAPAPPVVPDPSAGEVEPAAGRIEVAEGTPEPVAPLRTPIADLPAAAAEAATARGDAAAPAAVGASTAAAPVAAAPVDAATASTGRFVRSEEPEPLDLLDIAGGSIYKRVIPVAVGVVVAAAAVIVWFVARD
ncbi:SRPBCC family protein [Actinoplanes sp. NEAU-A12]|uniref:SRPBCC family protein n=1 Tax=Actinoplanes sandaracinus TaxID=3045177 RepID=A0ABT6WC26_9ACTN|nr:SRPBCC family protein [Actinoplanes sandaracinus]MDI6097260.1 SRPBCC family protein [Actinoplanes sandaracinus]